MSAATAPERAKRKTKVGVVVSDKMDKTVVVSVERLARHRIYKRVIRLTTKFKAHDENNEARVGDTVRIEEARPLSATKRWRLTEIVTKAGLGAGEDVVSEEAETAAAIHMAAHPGKAKAEETEATAEAPAADAPAEDAPAADAPAADAPVAKEAAVDTPAEGEEASA